MSLKKTYTEKDLYRFDRLLRKTELKGFDNYRRNMGRIELKQWLEGFTKETQDNMFAIVKDWQ